MGRDCDCPFFPSLHDLEAHPCSPSGCRWNCLVCAQDDVRSFQETGFAKPTPSQPEAVLPHGKLWECGSVPAWVDQSQDVPSEDKESKCPAMPWCQSSNTLATWREELTHWKRPWCWERLRAGGEGDDRGWDGWIASSTQWTWIWANFRR